MKVETWSIERAGDHWVLIVNDELYCTGDTFAECLKEIDDLRRENSDE